MDDAESQSPILERHSKTDPRCPELLVIRPDSSLEMWVLTENLVVISKPYRKLQLMLKHFNYVAKDYRGS